MLIPVLAIAKKLPLPLRLRYQLDQYRSRTSTQINSKCLTYQCQRLTKQSHGLARSAIRPTTIRRQDTYSTEGTLAHPLNTSRPNKYDLTAVFCPNPECRKTQLVIELAEYRATSLGPSWQRVRQWDLLPESKAKSFPDYIPAPILADYTEACLIASLSPKASATLARRCLQGMIRNFWGISNRRLKDEIDALEEKVDPETWDAIDSVRKIGNIGAHMEADINVIVDVDPNEADLLLGLIETLLSDWYVARHNRQQRMAKVRALAAEKESERNGTAAAKDPDAPASAP